MCAPCSGSLAEELHEPPFHAQPAEAGAVEQQGVEYQVQGNPLQIHGWCKKTTENNIKPDNTSCKQWS